MHPSLYGSCTLFPVQCSKLQHVRTMRISISQTAVRCTRIFWLWLLYSLVYLRFDLGVFPLPRSKYSGGLAIHVWDPPILNYFLKSKRFRALPAQIYRFLGIIFIFVSFISYPLVWLSKIDFTQNSRVSFLFQNLQLICFGESIRNWPWTIASKSHFVQNEAIWGVLGKLGQ